MAEIPKVESQSRSGGLERRRHLRTKIAVPIELSEPGKSFPIRAETADLSLGGCYVEMAFTLPVGTELQITMWIDEFKLSMKGKVVTQHPQFGNGIQFLRLAPENEARLQEFLKSAERQTLPRNPNAESPDR
jgi:c-di-GMP-binding flagellar brake protein YcgR